MKHASIGQILTPDEISTVTAIFERTPDPRQFVETIERELIRPNIDRINASLGQENDAHYLAHAVANAFMAVAVQAMDEAGDFTVDQCKVCGDPIGVGLKVLHVGLCDRCRNAPKH